MKILHEKVLKDGRINVLIQLRCHEGHPIARINKDAFYRLNYPHDEIVQGRHIIEPQRVFWDTLGQKWEEA